MLKRRDGCFALRLILTTLVFAAPTTIPNTGVLKLDHNWNIVTAIGFGKPGDPVFDAAHDIAVGPDGSIYVAETRTKRVVKLRPVK
jgi:DNA-binding beta-propeller fold protein YncE